MQSVVWRHSAFSLALMSLKLIGLSKLREWASTGVSPSPGRGLKKGWSRSGGLKTMKTTRPKRARRAMKPMTAPAMAPPLRAFEGRSGRGSR